MMIMIMTSLLLGIMHRYDRCPHRRQLPLTILLVILAALASVSIIKAASIIKVLLLLLLVLLLVVLAASVIIVDDARINTIRSVQVFMNHCPRHWVEQVLIILLIIIILMPLLILRALLPEFIYMDEETGMTVSTI